MLNMQQIGSFICLCILFSIDDIWRFCIITTKAHSEQNILEFFIVREHREKLLAWDRLCFPSGITVIITIPFQHLHEKLTVLANSLSSHVVAPGDTDLLQVL